MKVSAPLKECSQPSYMLLNCWLYNRIHFWSASKVQWLWHQNVTISITIKLRRKLVLSHICMY